MLGVIEKAMQFKCLVFSRIIVVAVWKALQHLKCTLFILRDLIKDGQKKGRKRDMAEKRPCHVEKRAVFR